jgi:hypothetical protein
VIARSISGASRMLTGLNSTPNDCAAAWSAPYAPGGQGGIPNDRHTSHARSDLFEQLQPFPADQQARGGAAALGLSVDVAEVSAVSELDAVFERRGNPLMLPQSV